MRAAAWVVRVRRPTGDTGSMPLAMLLTLVGVSLSALLASLAMTHVTSTRAATTRMQAEHAALAGLEVVLGHIRGVTRSGGYGTISTLPCPGSGRVAIESTPAASISYRTWVTYYSSRNVTLACPLGAAPAYARVRSEGSAPGGAAKRTLEARYTFQSTNANILGGLIHVHQEQKHDVDRCLDGGAMTVGTVVTIGDCTAGSERQLFAYTPQLTVKLVGANATSYPEGLCVDGVPAPAARVTLQRCVSPPAEQQRWLYNNHTNFEGVTGSSGNGFCWNAQAPGQSGFPVVMDNAHCNEGPYTNQYNFFPDFSVGAGAAGVASGQLVNFGQFGRCIDTPWHAEAGNRKPAFVQAWPCKQTPNPQDVAWNQRWTQDPVGGDRVRISAISPSSVGYYQPAGDWCLTSPHSSDPGAYVDAQSCTQTVLADAMKWTVAGLLDNYQDSYQIRDFWGDCLAAADLESTDKHARTDYVDFPIMKLVVQPCSDSALQKWNADPNALVSNGLEDFTER